jgi:protocatechuate 3,4-dioxygenase beta subunit
LRLRFIVMDAANCTPVPGARIEVWHARADGYYSGYPGQGDSRNVNTTGDTFMRGTQIEDARGEAFGTKGVPCMSTSRSSSTTGTC